MFYFYTATSTILHEMHFAIIVSKLWPKRKNKEYVRSPRIKKKDAKITYGDGR